MDHSTCTHSPTKAATRACEAALVSVPQETQELANAYRAKARAHNQRAAQAQDAAFRAAFPHAGHLADMVQQAHRDLHNA